jgi:hypothetical protein
MSSASVSAPSVIFDGALRGTSPRLVLRLGLQAIKKGEGHGQIVAKNRKRLLGSAAIDDDCRSAFPIANRWDYVIGYERARKAIAYFVEVHSAETSEVSKIEKKLRWLEDFLLQASQKKLAALDREYHWVASGRINIPKHVPQYRILKTTLRKAGLRGPVEQLVLT